MAKQNLKKIFLSASIPIKGRDPDYINSADIIAIRDAVRALATVVIPRARLVWGGHPSINPLIKHVLERSFLNVSDHVTLYLSEFFRKKFPADIKDFADVKFIQSGSDRDTSLFMLRRKMFEENEFVAGVFIGGMEGVEDEYNLFREMKPEAVLLPVATTGAAAKMIFKRYPGEFDNRLQSDYTYMAMFRDLLEGLIN